MKEEEIQKIVSEVLYSVTNESLDAVIEGLDLKPDDTVLSVGGSGDQAFAILEYVKKVIVVDINKSQINFIKLRNEALKQKEYNLFFAKKRLVSESDEKICMRKKYFSEKGRLERITAKLDDFIILPPANIFRVKLNEPVSKIYLSNTFSSVWGIHSVSDIVKVIKNLSLGGILYFTQSTITIRDNGIPELKTEVS